MKGARREPSIAAHLFDESTICGSRRRDLERWLSSCLPERRCNSKQVSVRSWRGVLLTPTPKGSHSLIVRSLKNNNNNGTNNNKTRSQVLMSPRGIWKWPHLLVGHVGFTGGRRRQGQQRKVLFHVDLFVSTSCRKRRRLLDAVIQASDRRPAIVNGSSVSFFFVSFHNHHQIIRGSWNVNHQ